MQDLLITMGTVDANADILGMECTGIVSQVGSSVLKLEPGDRVATFADGAFGTSVVVSQTLCTKIPDEMSFIEAAAMPMVYGTALHALQSVARLQKGQVSSSHFCISTVTSDCLTSLAVRSYPLSCWRCRNSFHSRCEDVGCRDLLHCWE